MVGESKGKYMHSIIRMRSRVETKMPFPIDAKMQNFAEFPEIHFIEISKF